MAELGREGRFEKRKLTIIAMDRTYLRYLHTYQHIYAVIPSLLHLSSPPLQPHGLVGGGKGVTIASANPMNGKHTKKTTTKNQQSGGGPAAVYLISFTSF